MAPACQALADLYFEWRKLTEAEGDAIQNARWQEVDAAQTAKLSLQPKIMEAAALWEPERQSQPETEHQVRSILQQLIELERRNGDLLAVQRQRAEEKQTEIDRTTRNLRHLRNSYRCQPASVWQSYS